MILIAGPCVIEEPETLRKIAAELRPLSENPQLEFYFKASFDKANRTSLESYRGPGIERGLELLSEIKKEFGYKILTDVHESCQVEKITQVADVIQIPAFLCRQTDLIVAAAKTACVVNIKKGQFMNPLDMRHSVLKAIKIRGGKSATYEESKRLGIWLTERGSTFGYGNLVVDMRSLVFMREFAPVIFDATHAVQMPGAADGKSGGDRRFVSPLSRAAAAVGVDGFFMETHIAPQEALSDGPNMITPSELKGLVTKLLALASV